MLLLSCIRVLALVVFVGGTLEDIKRDNYNEYEAICDEVTKEPYFMSAVLVEKPWRVYYSWNTKMDDVCMNVTFKYTNYWMIKHIRWTMRRYLEDQPNWSDGTLFLSMSRSRHMLLVLDGSGIPGRFIQVPHMLPHEYHVKPDVGEIPLLKMALKMYYKGRYYIMSDCSSGVTFLLAGRHRKPNREEIGALVSTMDYGDGMPACIIDT